jgi:hypothetical protein
LSNGTTGNYTNGCAKVNGDWVVDCLFVSFCPLDLDRIS